MSNWFSLNKSLDSLNKFRLLNKCQFVKQILWCQTNLQWVFSHSEFVWHAQRSILERTHDGSWSIPCKNLVLRKEIKLKFVWFPCAEQWFCMGFSQNLKTWISFDFLMYNNVIFMVPMVNESRLTCPSINPIILGICDRRKAGLPVGRTESLSPIVQTNVKSLNESGMSN